MDRLDRHLPSVYRKPGYAGSLTTLLLITLLCFSRFLMRAHVENRMGRSVDMTSGFPIGAYLQPVQLVHGTVLSSFFFGKSPESFFRKVSDIFLIESNPPGRQDNSGNSALFYIGGECWSGHVKDSHRFLDVNQMSRF